MLFEKLKRMGLSRDSLAGKVAIVTGAGRGIGRELARALAWLGAKVIIAEIADTGAEVENLIRSEGGTALYIQTDVSDEKSIKRLAEKTLKEFGKVDILINNATVVKSGSILELPLDEWDRSWAIDVRAAVLAIKAFLPSMLERKKGVIVTITSGEGMPYVAPYSATKAALNSLGVSLATELGDESGVSVFVFAPGMVDTPGIRNAARELAPRYGMTYEDFINQPVNPGYDGLMPAEDCAAGFAYCIVYAKNYHGQVADPFQPLSKFGLLPTLREIKPKPSKKASLKTPKPAISSLEPVTLHAQAIEHANEVQTIIEALAREFSELSFFQRSWVKRDFRKNVGIGIEDCQKEMAELVTLLQRLPKAVEAGDYEEISRIKEKLPYLKSILEGLVRHFIKNVKDAKGWIKDEKKLQVALEALEHRKATTKNLISAIDEILKIDWV